MFSMCSKMAAEEHGVVVGVVSRREFRFVFAQARRLVFCKDILNQDGIIFIL